MILKMKTALMKMMQGKNRLVSRLYAQLILKKNRHENDCFAARHLSRNEAITVPNQITAFAMVYRASKIILD